MSNQMDVLNRLATLTETDRSWILSKLSTSARDRLLRDGRVASPKVESQVATGSARDASSDHGSEHLVALVRTEPRIMVQLLRGESPFFVAALLSCHPWPWTSEVLEALGDDQSAKVIKLLENITVTPAMRVAILELAASGSHLIEPPVSKQVRSKFESLVERIGAARSKRRATHL